MFFNPSYVSGYFLHLQKTSEKQMLSEDIEKHQWHEMNPVVSTQPATTCSKLTTETLEGKSRLTNFCVNKIFSEISRRNIMLRLSVLTVSNNGPSSIRVPSCSGPIQDIGDTFFGHMIVCLSRRPIKT